MFTHDPVSRAVTISSVLMQIDLDRKCYRIINETLQRMEFPAYLTMGSIKLHPHPVFESIAYFVSFRLALRRLRKSTVQPEQRKIVIAGGLIGGMLGAKLLAIVQHLDLLWTGQVNLVMLQFNIWTCCGRDKLT